MSFALRFTPSVKKQIRQLDPPAAARIKTFLLTLDLENPRASGKALTGDLNIWRYRVGDYRILASISDKELLILVIDIDHRRQAYRHR